MCDLSIRGAAASVCDLCVGTCAQVSEVTVHYSDVRPYYVVTEAKVIPTDL